MLPTQEARLFFVGLISKIPVQWVRSQQDRDVPHAARRMKGILPLIAGLCLSLVSDLAWAGLENSRGLEGRETTVAAGFGYQIGEISTITVKTYDASTGDVLSDEVYELSVNEGDSGGSQVPQERIFAGGVGLGAEDLSRFTLRVYDAKTGAFQWEGQLNLMSTENGGAAQVVSASTHRRARVTKVHATELSLQQPMFVVRALDAYTGGLVWQDEFSADGMGKGWQLQPVARMMEQEESAQPGTGNSFDFRIRMFDRTGHTMLWEDRMAPQLAQEDTREAVDEQAHILPVWPKDLQQSSSSEAI